MSLSLEDWLVTVAGVTGRKLQSALSVCDEEELDTVEDLRASSQTFSLECPGLHPALLLLLLSLSFSLYAADCKFQRRLPIRA